MKKNNYKTNTMNTIILSIIFICVLINLTLNHKSKTKRDELIKKTQQDVELIKLKIL